MPSSRADALSAALDRLYAAPLEGFVALRKQLATELRAAGDAEAARSLLSSPKPNRTAWALDQVATKSPAVLRAMFEARDAAAEVQKAGGADDVRAAWRDYRARVADVLRAARDVLASSGSGATADQVRRMGESLQAAAAEGSETRRLLETGRLVGDAEQEDPLAGIEAGPAGPRPKKVPEKRDDGAKEAAAREAARVKAQRELEQGQARVEALEAEAQQAMQEARRAETAAERARIEAARARRAAEDAEARLRQARESLRAMRS